MADPLNPSVKVNLFEFSFGFKGRNLPNGRSLKPFLNSTSVVVTTCVINLPFCDRFPPLQEIMRRMRRRNQEMNRQGHFDEFSFKTRGLVIMITKEIYMADVDLGISLF